MFEDYSPLAQALTASLFTWFVTALGSATVFVFRGYKRSFLDASLGFAAGVMTAASFWSLLLPALEIADQQNGHGNKMYSLMPVVIGFLFGAFFVHLADVLLPENFLESSIKKTQDIENYQDLSRDETFEPDRSFDSVEINLGFVRQRGNLVSGMSNITAQTNETVDYQQEDDKQQKANNLENSSSIRLRKIFLMIIAVTVHNIPEGLAVGVGFGAIGKSKSATFQSARNLALGIGIQNFPEGLAVSLPLYASGYSYFKSFWYGQLSGMVEPIASVIGVLSVGMAQACLPYALSFAAGAMLYVVFENLMPEAASHGNGKLSTWSCLVGFCIMMSLDAGLN